jgi:hypothetical protein
MESESSPESFAARFPRVFPLPFRVVVLISAGILAWASNLHGLQHAGIIVSDGLEPGRVLESPSYSSIYLLHIIFSFWVFASWALFRSLTNADADNLDLYRSVPAICLVVILAALFAPFNVLCLRERRQFLRSVPPRAVAFSHPSTEQYVDASLPGENPHSAMSFWPTSSLHLPRSLVTYGSRSLCFSRAAALCGCISYLSSLTCRFR